MTVEDGGYDVPVQVVPELVEKMFLNIPADWLNKTIGKSLGMSFRRWKGGCRLQPTWLVIVWTGSCPASQLLFKIIIKQSTREITYRGLSPWGYPQLQARLGFFWGGGRLGNLFSPSLLPGLILCIPLSSVSASNSSKEPYSLPPVPPHTHRHLHRKWEITLRYCLQMGQTPLPDCVLWQVPDHANQSLEHRHSLSFRG